MTPRELLKMLCSDFRYELAVITHATAVYDGALARGYEKKHDPLVLAAGSLYYYCKSSGKPLTLRQLTEKISFSPEEITAVYTDLRRDVLG